jgi:hypothetical protein
MISIEARQPAVVRLETLRSLTVLWSALCFRTFSSLRKNGFLATCAYPAHNQPQRLWWWMQSLRVFPAVDAD